MMKILIVLISIRVCGRILRGILYLLENERNKKYKDMYYEEKVKSEVLEQIQKKGK